MPDQQFDKTGAQRRFLDYLRKGYNINGALAKVNRTRSTYELWRKESRGEPNGFAALADQAQALRMGRDDAIRGEKLSFTEFRRKYLNTETYWHQLQWIDLLEGKEPRQLHPAQTFVQGKRNMILVNCPPFHAKSITLTVDYAVYRLCMDPSFRILAISAGKQLAEDFLFAIKQRLTSPEYLDLQKAYAPDGGWEATAESWAAGRIVFGTDIRAQGANGSSEKDPNFQAVGMRSRIYGKRADLIIIDDAVDGNNVNEYEKQRKWLFREVASRLEVGGKLIVVGTRIASVDLYSDLLNEENYSNGRVPWTYLASPAILEEGETPADHVTLWPYSDRPWVNSDDDLDTCDCEGTDPLCGKGFVRDGVREFPRWNGIHLELGPRANNDAQQWALVYQQTSIDENATFPVHAVQKSIAKWRFAGTLEDNRQGHPIGGMRGKYIIASCDPAIKGYAGLLVIAVDRQTKMRYLLNAWNLKGPTPAALKDKIKSITNEYDVNEWRIEKTGLLQFFTQDEELRTWLSTRGVKFREHNTHKANKWDPGWGVASIATLFGFWEKDTESHGKEVGDWKALTLPLIELPRVHNNDSLKALIHQLVIWSPQLDPSRTPCDLVMALWFAEIGAREYLQGGRGASIKPYKRAQRFLPRGRKNRETVRIADLHVGGNQ